MHCVAPVPFICSVPSSFPYSHPQWLPMLPNAASLSFLTSLSHYHLPSQPHTPLGHASDQSCCHIISKQQTCQFAAVNSNSCVCYRYVHIGESHRGYLGTGSVDFPAFFRALAKYDYQGAVTFESFSSAVVSGSLSNTLCVWRNL